MSKRKPLQSKRKTSPGYSKVPHTHATDGKLYRVRDKGWAKVWGQGLTWADANKLKYQVVARHQSRTARVEDMAIPPPAGYVPGSVSDEPDIVAAQAKALAAVRQVIAPAVPRKPARPRPVLRNFYTGKPVPVSDQNTNVDDIIVSLDEDDVGLLGIGAEPSDDDIDDVLAATP